MECQNLECGWVEDQLPYPNEDQDAKPKSGAFSALLVKYNILIIRSIEIYNFVIQKTPILGNPITPKI